MGGGGSGGNGGSGGGDLGPCGMDCSQIDTKNPCLIAVCNTGQEVGAVNTCVVVPAKAGTVCDDGKFCTVNDACDGNGTCGGGSQNTCGMPVSPCVAVICYEDSHTCTSSPVNDGDPCIPKDLCQVDGACQLGECVGQPKDCSFSPLNECNTVGCDSTTGDCVGVPDTKKDDTPCTFSGDVCSVNKTCKNGVCGGGTPKDCSALNVGCQLGQCDANTGICKGMPAPVGNACSDGIPECHVGACDEKGACIPSAGNDGATCNDHDACTQGDTCVSGTCTGTSIAGCVTYYHEGFETCPSGWTFSGDWECGKPINVGPATAHTGQNVIATKIAGVYSVNQTYTSSYAQSPPIDLTTATNPAVSFWVWDHTEGGSYDGWNLKISVDGGPFLLLTSVTPAYPLMVGGQGAWGGDHTSEGWQNYTADLSNFHGHTVALRFSFRSDAATVYAGVYIDDVVVTEPPQLPLYISTTSPLQDTYKGSDYAVQINKTGGSNNVVWSLKSGGVNDAWLQIDSTTGLLHSVPGTQLVGPVTVNVHVAEATQPTTNFADKTFTFNVKPDTYYTSWEGAGTACTNGWTLTGDWQCGVPNKGVNSMGMQIGPAAAYTGMNCLATKLTTLYSDNQTFGGTTATSPDIDFSTLGNPKLTFRMFLDTEGSTYDGANLQVSSDGGANFNIVTTVMPPYNLTIGGKPAWGGHQAALQWQAVEADLSAYAGQHVLVRFAFQSDSSGDFAGVFIDDFFIP